MRKEIKTVVYDDELRLEAYRFEGVVQPFPNHFHEYYVIGFVEGGERCLSCRNQEYTIGKPPLADFAAKSNPIAEHLISRPCMVWDINGREVR